jgi:OmcA/MtrC family decaheme c-type cytochrome
MQMMVHKIHRGEALSGDYKLGSTSFKEVLYPGDLRNCAACHVNNSFQLPLPPTNIAVVTPSPNYYWTPTAPATAACIGCHDAAYTAAHAFINTADFGTSKVESCAVCHKEGADWAVGLKHAR